MGCFFSKKSKRKAKEEQTPTALESNAGSNSVPLGSSSDEAPKQYSWDTREKVRLFKRFIHTHWDNTIHVML